MHFRQGDIMFRRVANLPEKKEKKKDGVVALGEVTGHSHRILNGDVWDASGGLFVEAFDGTEAVHDEHGPIKLPPGIYEVVRQREFDGKTAPRVVRD